MDKLTIFYNKRTGSIKELCGGVQDMNWFGDEKEDYEQIFSYIVVDFDDYVISNVDKFTVENDRLKVHEQVVPSQYL